MPKAQPGRSFIVPPESLVLQFSPLFSTDDDAKEILDHALSVPVKQKSQGKIALTRGTSIVASDKPALLRQPSVSQSSTGAVVGGGSKAPPSPRGGASDGTGAVASEIPSGIVSRASMSLRRASTINAQDDKAIVSRPPRPANPSVLARAPSQVTEAAAVASGSPTGSLLLKRPTSVAAPLSPSHSAKLGPKAPPRPRPNNATPTAHVKQASTGNTSDTASDEQEARSGSVPIDSGSNPVSPKEKILNGDAHATVQAKSNVDANGTANAKVAPNGISTASDPHTPAAATPNGSAHANGTDTASAEAVSVETSKNAGDGAQVESPAVAQEMSFDVLQDHPTSLITRPSVANLFVEVKSTPKLEAPPPKVSVEPTSAPDSATRPTHEAESDTDSKASGMTARLTVEDAKPLILRQKSSLDETDDFVFDAPKPVFIDDEPAPTAEPVPASDPVSDPVSEPVSDPATPKAPKKSSKKNKQSAEAVESATASGNMEDSDPAVRVRAKTRRILGAESSVGTPFYGASDIAYLPRRFTQVPLMRVDSKRYLLESNGSQKTWKDMFSPDNLTLLPSGTISGYSDFIAREEHLNFVGEDKVDGGVVVISMLKRAAEDTDINCIVRTKNGDHSLLVPIPDKKPKDSSGWVSLLRKNAEISAIVEKRIALKMVTDPAFVADLEEVESKLDRKTYKFGIVYCKEGQKEEEEFLSNTQASEDFEEFIDWLGARISLQGWNKYDGGLDTKKNGTGEFSIFAEWKHIQMMFHVSTLMPAEGPADEWIQEKKVHIGNDVVVIVFMEGETAETVFNPKKFVSQFNHAFIVINPIRQKGVTLYRVNTVYKNGVKPCVPELPPDCIFERSDIFRYLLYTKLINSERSAFASVEQFSTSMANSRFHQLYNLGMKYAPAKEGGCLAGCSGKK